MDVQQDGGSVDTSATMNAASASTAAAAAAAAAEPQADIETKFFVQSFVRFLNSQIGSSTFPADIVESLEVASQCLETAYNLPVEAPPTPAATPAAAAPAAADPMVHIDLREMFRACCAGHPERKREADALKNEGNRLMREEKFNEALLYYNRAIGLDPTNPVFYCNRAATFSRLGDFGRAADDCRLSLRYEPRYSKAYGRLGIALSKLGQLEQSVQAYGRALELEPHNVDYQNNLQVAQQLLSEQQQQQQQQQQHRPSTATANGAEAGSSSATSTTAAGGGGPHEHQHHHGSGAGAGAFQMPANFGGIETLQNVMAQPAVQQLVQQLVGGDTSQVDMLRNVFQGGGGAGGGGGATGATGAAASSAAPNDFLANMIGALSGNGGSAVSLGNIGDLLSQLNSGAGGSPGATNRQQQQQQPPH